MPPSKLQSLFHSTNPQNPLLHNLSQREIPSLYGLRGIAAIVVIFYHYSIDWNAPSFPGYYSVTLFFELSGLLITWLLLKEIAQTQTIDRKQFYIRRSLRLFPVFYVVWILCRLTGPFPGSWFYFFYLGDYYTGLTGIYSLLTSAWSLGVEEKFYLIWPQIVRKVGLPKLTSICIAILILEPIYRAILTATGHEYYTHFAFETNLDPIVLGCLIAVAVKRGWNPPRWLLHPITLVLALAAGVLFWRSTEVVLIALAITLLYSIANPPLLLNNPITRYLGNISYSLYLIHEYTASVLWPHLVHPIHRFPTYLGITLEILLATAAATLLHYAIEQPFLRLKDRFHPHPRPVSASAVQ